MGGGFCFSSAVMVEKIVKKVLIAVICLSPMFEKGVPGAGFLREWASSNAEIVAFSAEELYGSGVLCGKNSTQSEWRSLRLFVI